MHLPQPLVLYKYSEPLSLTLFELCTEKIKAHFDIQFLEKQESIISAIQEKRLQPDLLIFEETKDARINIRELNSLRTNPYTSTIPLILLADDLETEYSQLAHKAGVFCVLKKPNSLEFMKTIVELINIILI